MKFLTVILFILGINIPCFAQQEVAPAQGKPTIRGFTIDVPLQQAKRVCLNKHKGTWEKMPMDNEYPVGTLYRCSSTLENGIFFHANVFVKDDQVVYIRLLINQKLCDAVHTRLNGVPECDEADTIWQYCSIFWKVSCYEAEQDGTIIHILDILSNLANVIWI